MTREGQERVEVRPGVFLWLNAEDRKRLAGEPPEPKTDKREPMGVLPVETATAEPPENASQPRPRRRTAG